MTVIGLSGKKQSGKNTVARMIVQQCKFLAIEAAFADALKDEVCAACGITREYLEEHKESFRLIMQGWGTDFRRRLQDDNYWVSKLGHRLLRPISKPDVVVITDVRFMNEATFIDSIGGVLVRINRGGTSDDTHVSETELDNYIFKHEIYNNASLDSLNNLVKRLLSNLHIQTKTTTP